MVKVYILDSRQNILDPNQSNSALPSKEPPMQSLWLPLLVWDAYPMGKFFHGHEVIPE